MEKRMFRTFAVAAAFVLCISVATARQWRLGLGVSYRSFDDVEFSGAPASGGGMDIARFLLRDGDLVPYTAGNLAAVIGSLPSGTGAINVVEDVGYSSSVFLGSDEEVDGALGPVLTAEMMFLTQDELTLSVVANFMYFSADADGSQTLGIDMDAELNQYFVVRGNMSPFPLGSGTPYGSFSGQGHVDYSFDMDMYELDLGVKVGYAPAQEFSLFLAGGPTLNLVDSESSVRQFANYSGPSGTGDVLFANTVSDGQSDVLFGLYASAGGQYWFNEQIGVVIEGRYDHVFDPAETDFAEMDLSGFSGMAKVLFRF